MRHYTGGGMGLEPTVNTQRDGLLVGFARLCYIVTATTTAEMSAT